MTAEGADPYADHDKMTNHWWWRPGWKIGTRFYAWHITQDEHPAVVELAARYQAALADVATLDPIPPEWQHMTLQGVGHVQDVDERDAARVVEAVGHHLADLPAISTTYQRAHIFREAIVLPPDNPETFTALRRAIRHGITDALGSTPEARDGFRAHVSVAYSNADAEAATIRRALDKAEPPTPRPATYRSVSLIRMHRDRRMYEWETIAIVDLGA